LENENNQAIHDLEKIENKVTEKEGPDYDDIAKIYDDLGDSLKPDKDEVKHIQSLTS
jgi:hypothetical protein